LISSIFLTWETMIVLAVMAAVCATLGSWMKIKVKGKRKAATVLIYAGYGFLGSSILIYIILGFK
jgi:hypothetical protein